MDKKKTIIFVIGSTLILVAFFALAFGLPYLLTQKKGQDIQSKAKDFSVIWLNYDSQDSPVYLERVKPLLTEGFYNTYTTALDSAKSVKVRNNIPNTASAFTPSSTQINGEKKNFYQVSVTGDQTLTQSGSPKTTKKVELIVEYTNNQGKLLVSNAYIYE